MNTDVMFSSKSDLWETPQDLFDKLDAEFHFNLDVCALPENAKCAAYYTPEMDGLSQPWYGRCWCNPPYGRGCGCLGTEGRSERAGGGNSSYAAAGEDGYEVVPPVDLSQGGDSVFARAAEIRRGKEQRAVSVDGVYMGRLNRWMM